MKFVSKLHIIVLRTVLGVWHRLQLSMNTTIHERSTVQVAAPALPIEAPIAEVYDEGYPPSFRFMQVCNSCRLRPSLRSRKIAFRCHSI